MKIIVKGNEEEIQRAKYVLESVCFFDSEFCVSGLNCNDCENEQCLEREFIVEEEKYVLACDCGKKFEVKPVQCGVTYIIDGELHKKCPQCGLELGEIFDRDWNRP